jgi:hypothetical protein
MRRKKHIETDDPDWLRRNMLSNRADQPSQFVVLGNSHGSEGALAGELHWIFIDYSVNDPVRRGS